MARVQWKFGADISDLEKAFNRVDRKMQKFGRQCEKTGKLMAKTLTVPIVAVGTAATKAAMDVDKANQTIARGTGATGKQLKSLQKNWKSLAGQVSQNFDTSSQVLADYNTRLGLTDKSLVKVSKQALDAGKMMDQDVNQIVEQSAKAMKDWGVETDNMSLTMDQLFKASQNTGIGIAKLGTELYKYGSPLRQMGFDMDEAIALMASFDKAGVNTELVLGSLRIALGKMSKEGITDTSEGLRMIIEDIKTAGSVGEANAIAIEKFGSRAGPDMAAAIREGRFEVDDLVKTLENASGAIDKSNDATKTIGDRWSETKNQMMLALEPLGNTVLTMANDYVPKLQEKITGLSDKIAGMSTESRDSIIKLAGALAVGGPLLIAVSSTIKAVNTLKSTLFMIASPAGAIITVIGALIILAESFEGSAEKAAKFNSEIQKIDTDKVKELQKMGMGGALGFSAEGWKGSIATAVEQENIAAQIKAQGIDADFVDIVPDDVKKKVNIPTPTPTPTPSPAPTKNTTTTNTVKNVTNAVDQLDERIIAAQEAGARLAQTISDWGIENTKLQTDYSDLGSIAGTALDKIEEQTEEITKKTDNLATKSDLWTNDLNRGLADAIVNGESLSDVVDNLLKQFASSALQQLIGGMFGGTGGGGILSLFGMHSGGVVGQDHSFIRKIPRMHSGGIVGADEQLTILQKGETVLPKGSTGGDVEVNVYNQSGTPLNARSESTFDGARTVISLFLDGYSRNLEGIQGVF